MPGDGNNLFHSRVLGIRDAKRCQAHSGNKGNGLLVTFFPWDTGTDYEDIMQITKTEGACGDGRRTASASQVYSAKIRVARDQKYTFGDTRAQWQIRFGARLEHFDVVVRANHVAAKTARPADKGNTTCAQAGIGQTETIVGNTSSQSDNMSRLHHGKVERWGVSGCRKRAHLGALTQHAVLTLNVGAAGRRSSLRWKSMRVFFTSKSTSSRAPAYQAYKVWPWGKECGTQRQRTVMAEAEALQCLSEDQPRYCGEDGWDGAP